MKPFLHGRNESKGKALTSTKITSNGRVEGMVRHSHPPEAVPTVEVIKEGDKVVRLVVRCSCGESIEVECLYSA